jgi:DNA-binding transcriptional MocR family regulator
MLDLGQYQIKGTTAREIAHTAEAAIREGVLETGDALPTVRALAQTLGTSPATVNAAYRILRERGLVLAEGRRGTRVAPRPALRTPTPTRPRDVPRDLPPGVRDLAIGLPDPALLPPLPPALARIDIERKLQIGGLERSDPELLGLARAAFEADQIPAGALAVVAGAFDGIERVLQAHLRPGDRVIVEDPAYIGFLDLLRALGLIPVAVPVDESGLLPGSFDRALRSGAEAVLVVPRAQNPVGSALDADRSAELGAILGAHPDILLIEDDHAGVVSGAPPASLVPRSWPRWAVIRSVSKTLHPDLRLAVMAGDELTIARVEGRQALGPRWVSHVLQAIVAELLRDPSFETISRTARDTYASRRRALIDALAEQGILAQGRSGLNVWVPVREEAPMLRALLDAGWLVLAGERFRIDTPPGIRITTATLEEHDAPAVAAAIARVEHAARPRRLY